MTFTLAGAAGSRIDLAGDIEVSRGAAGFFADTVRLAGMVRAKADVGAAGQIIADAASDLIVDGDARLDVSGNPGADAGAVRLSAVRTIKVTPSVEINADGGAFVAGQPAAFGGLIELTATEVQLPGALSANAPSPIHARGFAESADPLLQYPQYGRANVLESGLFSWGVIEGPSSRHTSTSTSLETFDTQGEILNARSTNDEVLIGPVAPSGDENFLTISIAKKRDSDSERIIGGKVGFKLSGQFSESTI